MAVYESAVEFLVQKLNGEIVENASLLHGLGGEVQWIKVKLGQIQRCFRDAHEKQGRDERVKQWMQDVKDAVYDVEDLIDRMVSKTEVQRQGGFMGSVKRCALPFNKFIARCKLVSDIERINTNILSISQRIPEYDIRDTHSTQETICTLRRPRGLNSAAPLIEEPEIVGLELESLEEQLMEGLPDLCVVCVVGEEGIGKTTVARKLYNDYRVKRHFDSRTWISVSQDSSLEDLLLEIINCSMAPPSEELNMVARMDIEELMQRISNYLKDQRYLIVLDEIWGIEASFAVEDAFPDMNNGSRVLLTTSNKNAPSYLDTPRFIHEVQPLTEDESWRLFCKKALIHEQDVSYSRRGSYLWNEKISLFCDPQAIIVLRGILSRQEEQEWENVLESIVKNTSSYDYSQIHSILSFGYEDLPYNLKPCFLYLGIFPEDYEFRTNKMIQLWVAEGFLQQRVDDVTAEELGEDFLLELIERGMVQVAERSSSGCIKSCRISGCLRRFSKAEAQKEKFLNISDGNSRPWHAPTSHRLALNLHFNPDASFQISSVPLHLRSLLCLKMAGLQLDFRRLKLLRVLDLEGSLLTEWPVGIEKLIHLRYLGFRRTNLKCIPPSAGNLQNLLTLDVKFTSIDQVPDAIQQMKGLRHLYVNRDTVIRNSWIIESLIDIQTVPVMHDDAWMVEGLAKLTNIRKLGICGDLSYCNKALSSLSKLQSLRVAFGFGNTILDLQLLPRNLLKLNLERRLENLHQLPENLVKLSLRWTLLEEDHLATLGRHKNLRKLLLGRGSFVEKKMVCTSGSFPQLEFLILDFLNDLEELRVESGALPSLKHLVIRSCKRLKQLPDGLEHVTTLDMLESSLMPDEFKASESSFMPYKFKARRHPRKMKWTS